MWDAEATASQRGVYIVPVEHRQRLADQRKREDGLLSIALAVLVCLVGTGLLAIFVAGPMVLKGLAFFGILVAVTLWGLLRILDLIAA